MPNNSDLSAPAAANGDKIVYLLKPRGFCAGVVRAVDIVELALRVYGPPIYVRKEIVHNRYVVDGLAARGAVFVEELDEVPVGGRTVFSAHGVAPAVRAAAEQSHQRFLAGQHDTPSTLGDQRRVARELQRVAESLLGVN